MEKNDGRIKLILARMKLRREIMTRLWEEIEQRIKEIDKHAKGLAKDSQEVKRLHGDDND